MAVSENSTGEVSVILVHQIENGSLLRSSGTLETRQTAAVPHTRQ